MTLAMGGGDVPELSYDEWCEAELLMGEVDGEEVGSRCTSLGR